jgi:hypothetical protein
MTAYGFRFPDGREDWGDDDGEFWDDGRSTYAKPANTQEARALQRANGWERATLLVKRFVVEEIEVVPPTRPGSVIVAAIGGETHVVGLSADTDGLPWIVLTGSRSGEWMTTEDMRVLSIIHDAGA